MLYIYICMKALERDHKVNEMKVEMKSNIMHSSVQN